MGMEACMVLIRMKTCKYDWYESFKYDQYEIRSVLNQYKYISCSKGSIFNIPLQD